jgi:hypothetical protein
MTTVTYDQHDRATTSLNRCSHFSARQPTNQVLPRHSCVGFSALSVLTLVMWRHVDGQSTQKARGEPPRQSSKGGPESIL